MTDTDRAEIKHMARAIEIELETMAPSAVVAAPRLVQTLRDALELLRRLLGE